MANEDYVTRYRVEIILKSGLDESYEDCYIETVKESVEKVFAGSILDLIIYRLSS